MKAKLASDAGRRAWEETLGDPGIPILMERAASLLRLLRSSDPAVVEQGREVARMSGYEVGLAVLRLCGWGVHAGLTHGVTFRVWLRAGIVGSSGELAEVMATFTVDELALRDQSAYAILSAASKAEEAAMIQNRRKHGTPWME
jgi:hypothetical protein